jgi:hypothetical protein
MRWPTGRPRYEEGRRNCTARGALRGRPGRGTRAQRSSRSCARPGSTSPDRRWADSMFSPRVGDGVDCSRQVLRGEMPDGYDAESFEATPEIMELANRCGEEWAAVAGADST